MKYIDINKRFTEIVTEYLVKGYTLNSRSMSGSQGEFASIDLTDGTEVIRVLVAPFHEWTDAPLEGVEIVVGRASAEVKPNSCEDRYTIWNNRLDVISAERFYEIATKRNNEKFYGTREEAIATQQVRLQRYIAKCQNSKTEDLTPKVMEIAKRIIRREFGVKRICEADVKVSKCSNERTHQD